MSLFADPLGAINLESSSYVWMTQAMMDFADQCCEGRVISLLEGGYDLSALAESAKDEAPKDERQQEMFGAEAEG